ncbi:uncharacterized protein TNCV_2429751 [Trichonephila clavipes]|nr:uncharacterized protein TNCV_2429751 [Trichonephila clavipes]
MSSCRSLRGENYPHGGSWVVSKASSSSIRPLLLCCEEVFGPVDPRDIIYTKTRLRKPSKDISSRRPPHPEWYQVVFSDESRFNLSSDGNRVCMWSPCGERLNPAFALQQLTTPTAGVMEWGAIAYNAGSPLVLIRGSMIARECEDTNFDKLKLLIDKGNISVRFNCTIGGALWIWRFFFGFFDFYLNVMVHCSHSSIGTRTVAKQNRRIEGARSRLFTLRLKKWADLPLHQVAEYVKHLGIAPSMNVRESIGFKNSVREICPSVIKLGQDDHRPWMTKPYSSASIFNRVLSDEKWVLYVTPKCSEHWLPPQGTVSYSARPPMHPSKIMLCVWWTCRQMFTMNSYQQAKQSLQTCIRINWNVYNRHCIRRSQHWLVERMYCYCMIMRGYMPHGWPGMRYADLVGRLCTILITAPSDYHFFNSLDNHLCGKSLTN